MSADQYQLKPIGVIKSCFGEKFGTPRQPGLVPAARATLLLDVAYKDAVKGLDGFSHIWLCFWFNQTADQGWSPTVRPPRLGGNQRVGVFATRSNFRPNPMGWSVVELQGIEIHADVVKLSVGGADIVDGTPLLDIKPYLPYADSLPSAQAGFASAAPEFSVEVRLAPELTIEPTLKALIQQTIGLDPRPAYKGLNDRGNYGTLLNDFDVNWRMLDGVAEVYSVKKSK